MRLPRHPSLMTAIAMVVLVGCSAAPQSTSQSSRAAVGASPSVRSIPSASAAVSAEPSVASASPRQATASPASDVTSTTSSALVGPKGSIRDEMYNVAYHPSDITAPAGTLAIFLVNPAGKSLAEHAMVIGKAVGQTITASEIVPLGQSAVFTIRGLSPGKYVFWCPIDGHASEGMVGTLTIR
jgi:uncharacterized cupredoxin-like copper-binding protein